MINSEKLNSLPNRFFPKLLIAKEIFEFKSNKNCKIKNEKFIQIPKIINLKINCFGDSILEYVKCAKKYLIAK